MATRDKTVAALVGLGLLVCPSAANFVFCTLPGVAGGEVQQYLREGGVLVRRFAMERIKEWLRITIGLDEEMDEVSPASFQRSRAMRKRRRLSPLL
jgi:histidinol-phosphate aminotransferase